MSENIQPIHEVFLPRAQGLFPPAAELCPELHRRVFPRVAARRPVQRRRRVDHAALHHAPRWSVLGAPV